MNKNIKNSVKLAIIDLLKEENKKIETLEEKESKSEKKPKKPKTDQVRTSSNPQILTRGAFGSGGRARSFVLDAKARAEKDPEGLMKDLGVRSASGGTDEQRVLSVLNAAIHSNRLMSQAYTGAAIRVDSPADSDGQTEGIAIAMGKLDRKNGVRFLAHTLTAAQNAGILNLDSSVQFSRGKASDIFIFSV